MEGDSKEMSKGIDSGNIKAFRAAYNACEGESFMFEGKEVWKAFAKHALQYWDIEQKRREEQLRRN